MYSSLSHQYICSRVVSLWLMKTFCQLHAGTSHKLTPPGLSCSTFTFSHGIPSICTSPHWKFYRDATSSEEYSCRQIKNTTLCRKRLGNIDVETIKPFTDILGRRNKHKANLTNSPATQVFGQWHLSAVTCIIPKSAIEKNRSSIRGVEYCQPMVLRDVST